MSIYLDKLADGQFIINCQYSVAQMCNPKDMLARFLCAPSIDDVMRNNTLKTDAI